MISQKLYFLFNTLVIEIHCQSFNS